MGERCSGRILRKKNGCHERTTPVFHPRATLFSAMQQTASVDVLSTLVHQIIAAITSISFIIIFALDVDWLLRNKSQHSIAFRRHITQFAIGFICITYCRTSRSISPFFNSFLESLQHFYEYYPPVFYVGKHQVHTMAYRSESHTSIFKSLRRTDTLTHCYMEPTHRHTDTPTHRNVTSYHLILIATIW